MNYTYILRCGDGTLYTGWTNDLEKRVAAHQAGRGGKYTRAHGPVALVYSEAHDTREAAMPLPARGVFSSVTRVLSSIESPLLVSI